MNEKAEARILSQSTFSRKSSAARDIPGHVHGGWHRHGQVLVPVGGVGEGLVLRLLGPVVLAKMQLVTKSQLVFTGAVGGRGKVVYTLLTLLGRVGAELSNQTDTAQLFSGIRKIKFHH